ncbi:MAG: acyl--CoA ligase [Clostridiales bacterium]|jgi:long-chain acyl-CoA synthetase|nr:acyl--CoA ligase [Clostridiales bacterium]
MIIDWIFDRRNDGAAAVLDGGRAVTFLALREKIGAVQRGLMNEQGGVIALCLPNTEDYLSAFFGVILAGRTVFPLNVLMTAHEISLLIKQGGVSAVLTSAEYRPLFLEEAPADRRVLLIEDMYGAGMRKPILPTLDNKSAIVFLGTSGTTGKVKIAALTKRNIEASLTGYLSKMDFERADPAGGRFVIALPFSSAYGMMCLCACMAKGLPIVLLRGAFTPELFYKTIAAHRVTHYEGSPLVITFMVQMANRAVPYAIESLKYLGFGGNGIPAETIKKMSKLYPQIELSQGYGMSEASPLIAKHQRSKRIKPDSVGTAIRGAEIVIRTADGITKAPGKRGEILVRGANVMRGYYKNEEETQKAIQNGYLYTGDIGYLDRAGYLYICGRKKNCMMIRGFPVQPEEVEACILNGSLATDCKVYAGRDRFGNESLCARVVPVRADLTAQEIRAHCRRYLASYKCPEEIQFCAEIQKNAAGKTDRKGSETT